MASTLERMGFDPTQRVVITHADDLGMCHASNAAFEDILAAGVVNCGSVMVPCPWFRHLARLAQTHPEADVGVHLALTSEWQAYRWGPVSTRDVSSGLLDDQGYLWADLPPLHSHMDPKAAVAEMRAQVERALEAGIDVTHIDTHMGAIAHPSLLEPYIDLGRQFGVPVMLPRLTREMVLAQGVPEDQAEALLQGLHLLESEGDLLLVDHLSMPHAGPGEDVCARYHEVLRNLEPGLTHLIYHPCKPTPESRAILGEARLAQRAGDWETFRDPALATVLDEAGVVSIGYRRLREVIRDT